MNAAAGAALNHRIARQVAVEVDPAVAEFARALAEVAGARAVLFYGSNLRTGSREGVLDFYVLTAGVREAAIWPRVSYHEAVHGGTLLRAKVAGMTLATFARAAAGGTLDTTIWARFVQPCALVWAADAGARGEVVAALAAAAITAARLAAALGPEDGPPGTYWRALFRATYAAEFRIEAGGREESILAAHPAHFAGLLPLALAAGGIDPRPQGDVLAPHLPPGERARILSWWARRRRLGKPLNLVRLLKASLTFEGAAAYAAWKIERHTGMRVELGPLGRRFPLLAAPGVLWSLGRRRRQRG